MNKIFVKIFYGILVLSLVSCDSEFNYQFKGIVNSKGKPLNNVKVEYHFLPYEDAINWRANVEDSILITNSQGEFLLNHSTVTLRFDSIKFSISKQGYEDFEFISKNDNWDENITLNKKEISKIFEPINLIEIDSSTYCKTGINIAKKQAQSNKFVHHEILKFGQRNMDYWDRFERELKNQGISLKTIQLFPIPISFKSVFPK